MKKVILDNIEKYPLIKLVDVFKLIHQSSFGCGHIISDYLSFVDNVKREYNNIAAKNGSLYEEIGEGYCRIDLKTAKFFGIDAELIAKLCYYSSFSEVKSTENFYKNISLLREMSLNNQVDFSTDDIDEMLSNWKNNGKGLFRHSEIYNELYNPSYRICESKYACFLFLLDRISKISAEKKIVVGIDGRCASGKTTLSKLLGYLLDCNIIHTDDFFIPINQRDNYNNNFCCNIDYVRFNDEVIKGIKSGGNYEYNIFDCTFQRISENVKVTQKNLTIIEGSYCLHPAFQDIYDIKVFLTSDPSTQALRIINRNGQEKYKMFQEKWIPMEEEYFNKYQIKNNCDFVIKTN